MLSVVTSVRKGERGVILVIAVLVMMLGVIGAMVASNTTRLNVITSGKMRGKVAAGYDAETCLYKALSKIRQDDEFYTNDSGNFTKLWGTFDKSTTDVTTLDNCEDIYDWSEGGASVKAGIVSGDGTYMCNYLGSEMESARASLRREVDFNDADAGHSAAVYLLSCIAKKTDSFERMQAVVFLPLTVLNFTISQQDLNSDAYFGAQIRLN